MGSAHAQDVSWTDARGDMARMQMDSDVDTYLPAPAHTNADVRRVTVRHDGTTLVIREKFVELRLTGVLLVGGEIRTDTASTTT
jgi:hypothetical protein